MKWIVAYIFVQLVMTVCPSHTPVPDEFGRTYQRQHATLEACFEESRQNITKTFDTEKEARGFAEMAYKETDLENIRVYSIEEKK